MIQRICMAIFTVVGLAACAAGLGRRVGPAPERRRAPVGGPGAVLLYPAPRDATRLRVADGALRKWNSARVLLGVDEVERGIVQRPAVGAFQDERVERHGRR